MNTGFHFGGKLPYNLDVNGLIRLAPGLNPCNSRIATCSSRVNVLSVECGSFLLGCADISGPQIHRDTVMPRPANIGQFTSSAIGIGLTVSEIVM